MRRLKVEEVASEKAKAIMKEKDYNVIVKSIEKNKKLKTKE